MILGDVDVPFAEQRADATNDTGDVVVGEDEQRLPWIHIHVE